MEPTLPGLPETIQAMKDRGIGVLYGRWLIEGAPRVLLFDTKTARNYMDEWKADLWNVASIPTPDGDEEMNEAVVFGYLVAWFLGEVSVEFGSRLGFIRSYCRSLFAMRRRRPSLPTSTNGSQVL